jgi:hypothetical protein
VLDLARRYQVLDCARHIFNRNRRVDAVLIEDVDNIGPEAFEGTFSNRFDMYGTAIEAPATLPRPEIDIETELGCEDYSVAHRGKRFAYEIVSPNMMLIF